MKLFAIKINAGAYHSGLHGLYHTPVVGDWAAAHEVLVDSDPSSQAPKLPRSTNFIRRRIDGQVDSLGSRCD